MLREAEAVPELLAEGLGDAARDALGEDETLREREAEEDAELLAGRLGEAAGDKLGEALLGERL